MKSLETMNRFVLKINQTPRRTNQVERFVCRVNNSSIDDHKRVNEWKETYGDNEAFNELFFSIFIQIAQL